MYLWSVDAYVISRIQTHSFPVARDILKATRGLTDNNKCVYTLRLVTLHVIKLYIIIILLCNTKVSMLSILYGSKH